MPDASLPQAMRRARLAAALNERGGGIALVPTAPERPRNADSDHPYRHGSDFHYLSGFDEPQAWLLVAANGHSTLLCRERHEERELWDGRRLGVDAAPAALGVDAAFDVEQLDALMPGLLANQPAVWFPFGDHPGLGAQVEGWLATVRSRARDGVACPQAVRDLAPLLGEMRLHKDDGEIATMRRAAAISAGAHARAMRFCAAHFRAGAGRGLPE